MEERVTVSVYDWEKIKTYRNIEDLEKYRDDIKQELIEYEKQIKAIKGRIIRVTQHSSWLSGDSPLFDDFYSSSDFMKYIKKEFKERHCRLVKNMSIKSFIKIKLTGKYNGRINP